MKEVFLTPPTLGNPRFSDARKLTAFLHGKTRVFPTLFQQVVLFFPLLMKEVFFTPPAPFLEFDFSLNKLFVFA